MRGAAGLSLALVLAVAAGASLAVLSSAATGAADEAEAGSVERGAALYRAGMANQPDSRHSRTSAMR